MTNETYYLNTRSNLFSNLLKKMMCTNVHAETEDTEEGIKHITRLFQRNNDEGGAIYVIGNGGSAAVATHAVTDFVNACHLRAFTLHESSLITCMANDFGYESSFQLILKSVFRKNDILIAISSSGQSPNMQRAAETANSLGGTVITFSGFRQDNILRKMGFLNFWLDSNDYGMVEIGHLFVLHNIADRISVGVKKDKKIEYSLS